MPAGLLSWLIEGEKKNTRLLNSLSNRFRLKNVDANFSLSGADIRSFIICLSEVLKNPFAFLLAKL